MLSTNIMGMKCKNPIVISAGPWTRGREKLKEAIKSGAGAIVTETIVCEAYPEFSPRYIYDPQIGGLENIRLYSGIGLERWIEELEHVQKENRYNEDCLIIASIMGSSSSELAYIAKKLERTGIDGIELGLSCPMGEGSDVLSGKEDVVYEYTKAVVDAVSIPVSVKLSQSNNNISAIAKAAEKAGASGISAINAVRCIMNVDIENEKVALGTFGGYSGTPIKPLGLSMVAMISQCTKLPVVGIGGIGDYKSLLEYIMIGAGACGIGTAILINGYEIVGKIINDMEDWKENHKYSSIGEMKGIAIKGIKAFEEIKEETKKAKLILECEEKNCAKCIKCCIENAIIYDKGIKMISSECTGCGLCIHTCPENKIKLNW